MSPLQIEIMLHHYYTPAEWDGPTVVQKAPGFRWLIDAGLLRQKEEAIVGDSIFVITSRGCAYVAALTELPLPEPCWRLPGSDKIIEAKNPSPDGQVSQPCADAGRAASVVGPVGLGPVCPCCRAPEGEFHATGCEALK